MQIYIDMLYIFLHLLFSYHHNQLEDAMLLENSYLSKKLKDYYPLQILELSMIMALFGFEYVYIATVCLTLLSIAINSIIKRISDNNKKVVKKDSKFYKNLPIGFYLCSCNILIMILFNFIAFKGGK